MIKSNRDFIPQIAEEFQLPEKEISNIIDFYFRAGKTKAEEMSDTDIYFYGLGTLSAKRKKIYDLISYFTVKKEKVLENLKLSEERKLKMVEDCDFKINQLNILKQKYKDKDDKRKRIKLEQKTTIGSFQEQNSNLGRVTE